MVLHARKKRYMKLTQADKKVLGGRLRASGVKKSLKKVTESDLPEKYMDAKRGSHMYALADKAALALYKAGEF
jgi:hypothetical protein